MQLALQHFQPGRLGYDLFRNGPMPWAIVDRDGVFLECNGAFTEFFGYSPQELIGTSYALYTHPADLEADNKAVRYMLDPANPDERYEMVKRYLHKVTGVPVWFRLVVYAVWKDPKTTAADFSHFFVLALPVVTAGSSGRATEYLRKRMPKDFNIKQFWKDYYPHIILFGGILLLVHPDIFRGLLDVLKAILK